MNNTNPILQHPNDRVMFTLHSLYPPLTAFFQKYVNFYNQIFQLNQIPAYVELIYGGLLWIIENLTIYRQIVQHYPAIQKQFVLSPDFKQELRNEMINTFQFQNQPLIIQIELNTYSSQELFPLFQEYFHIINPKITVEQIDLHQVRLVFPDLDGLIDYLGPLYLRIK